MHSLAETTALFGVDAATIRRWRVKAGLPQRQEGGGYTDAELAQLAEAAKRPNPLHAQRAQEAPPMHAQAENMHAQEMPLARATMAEKPDTRAEADTSMRVHARASGDAAARAAGQNELLQNVARATARIESQLAGIHALLESLLQQGASAPFLPVDGPPVSDSPARVQAIALTPAEHGRIWGRTTRLSATLRAQPITPARLQQHATEARRVGLPDGSLPWAAFAAVHHITEHLLKNARTRGDVQTTPIDQGAADGRLYHWLTPEQQATALAWWHQYQPAAESDPPDDARASE